MFHLAPSPLSTLSEDKLTTLLSSRLSFASSSLLVPCSLRPVSTTQDIMDPLATAASESRFSEVQVLLILGRLRTKVANHCAEYARLQVRLQRRIVAWRNVG